jgi:hypothetical protein
MTKYKMLVLALPLVFGLTALTIPRQTGNLKSSLPKTQKKAIDINNFPIAEFAAADQSNSKRKARGEKRNRSKWNVDPEALSDSTVIVDSVDVHLSALPVEEASAVVIGTVVGGKAYLSNDKTGVYSSFTVLINEVLKNSENVRVGNLVEAEREGGRVQFPSGRVHLYMISEQDMPRVGGRYLFFLTATNSEGVFEILTGYELRQSSVYALDDLPKTRSYESSTPAVFLNELRTRLTNP